MFYYNLTTFKQKEFKMIKLTNTILIGLLSAGLLVGCGSDNDSDSDDATQIPTETPDTPTTPAPTTPTAGAKTFSSDVMPVLVSKCQSCHGTNGSFTVTTANNTYNNIVAMKGSAVAGGQYVLDKGSNTQGHGGGNVIATSSAEYATIKSWVDAGAANN
jgi:cytochrome c553